MAEATEDRCPTCGSNERKAHLLAHCICTTREDDHDFECYCTDPWHGAEAARPTEPKKFTIDDHMRGDCDCGVEAAPDSSLAKPDYAVDADLAEKLAPFLWEADAWWDNNEPKLTPEADWAECVLLHMMPKLREVMAGRASLSSPDSSLSPKSNIECAWCHRMTDVVVQPEDGNLCICLPCEDAYFRGKRAQERASLSSQKEVTPPQSREFRQWFTRACMDSIANKTVEISPKLFNELCGLLRAAASPGAETPDKETK